MLLEFRTKNYRSFVDETVFSLTAAPKQKGLEYSPLIEKIKGKNVKGLCSSLIYGPNAAGKTNIIGAMDIYRVDSMQIIKRFVNPKKQTVYVEKTTNNAARLFGINSNALGYVVSEDDADAKLCSIFQNAKDKKSAAMAAEIFESYGTIRFVNMFPLVIRAILTGGTLVVDEHYQHIP